MSLADDLWYLLGSWSGVEEQAASPWAPSSQARAALAFRLDLGGTAVLQDYRQVRADGAELSAHGVLLADEDGPGVVLWWLFDSYGHVPEVARGAWSGSTLELLRPGRSGTARHRFAVTGDHLTYEIDVTLGGAEPVPFLRGRYERVSGH